MAIVTIPQIGSVGVVRDVQPHELPLSGLSDAQNVRFSAGNAGRIAGETKVFNTPAITPYYVQVYHTNNKKFVVYAGTSAVYADEGLPVDITGPALTGGPGDRWTGGVLNGVLVMNNGADVPMFWGGNPALNLAALTGWDAAWRCRSIRPFKNYLISMHLTKSTQVYPHMVKWSAAADPGTVPASWNAADPSIDAGEIDLSETSGVIVDGLQMGDNFVIYKTDSMYAMTYIGGQYIWQFRRLPGEVGALAPGCVCNIPKGHLVLTVGDVVVHNGMGPDSILTNKMRAWLFDTMDEQNASRSFVVSNPALNEAWVCFPERGQDVCTKALIWNWVDNTFSIRQLNNVTYGTSGQYEYTSVDPWQTDTQAWEDDTTFWAQSDIPANQSRFLLCSTAPALLGTDVGSDFDGVPFTAKIERVGLSVDAPDRVKLLRSIYPRVDGTTTGGTVYIQAAGAMDVEGVYEWSDPVPFVIGSTYKADLFASGRFLGYRIYTTDRTAWRVRSIDLDVVPMGVY